MRVLATTTPSVEGQEIRDYLGIVAGETIVGANLFKDLFASIRNLVGGRAAAYEGEMEGARAEAMAEMFDRASALGANAVVGVSLDYEVITTTGGSMLMVCVSGTAVRLSSPEQETASPLP